MNLLIIGGLLALGIALLAGAVLLALGDKKGAPAKKATTITPPPAVKKEQVTPTPAPVSHLPAVRKEVMPAPALNGQLHDLVTEIRSLHEQAAELSQRLSILNALIDSMEKNRQNQITLQKAEYTYVADPA